MSNLDYESFDIISNFVIENLEKNQRLDEDEIKEFIRLNITNDEEKINNFIHESKWNKISEIKFIPDNIEDDYNILFEECIEMFNNSEYNKMIVNSIKKIKEDEIEYLLLNNKYKKIGIDNSNKINYIFEKEGPSDNWIKSNYEFLDKNSKCYLPKSIILDIFDFENLIIEGIKVIIEYFDKTDFKNFKILMMNNLDIYDSKDKELELLFNRLVFFLIWKH